MKKIRSIIGIIVGIISACALLMIFAVLYYFTSHGISNNAEDYSGNMDYFNESGILQLIGYIQFQPLLFALNIVSIVIIVGVPGYITARIAKNNYILHSLVIGFIYSILPFVVEDNPLRSSLDIFYYTLIIPISFIAGVLCKNHMQKCKN